MNQLAKNVLSVRPTVREMAKHLVDPSKSTLDFWQEKLQEKATETENCRLCKNLSLHNGHYAFSICNATFEEALMLCSFFVELLSNYKRVDPADILWDIRPTQERHNGNYTISAHKPAANLF